MLHQQERRERKRAPKTNALHKLQIVVRRRSVGCFRSRGTSPIKKSLPLGDLFVWKELVRTQLQRGYPSSDKLEYFPYQLTPVVANFSTGAQSPFEWLFSQPLSYSGSRMFFDAALGKVSGREREQSEPTMNNSLLRPLFSPTDSATLQWDFKVLIRLREIPTPKSSSV